MLIQQALPSLTKASAQQEADQEDQSTPFQNYMDMAAFCLQVTTEPQADSACFNFQLANAIEQSIDTQNIEVGEAYTPETQQTASAVINEDPLNASTLETDTDVTLSSAGEQDAFEMIHQGDTENTTGLDVSKETGNFTEESNAPAGVIAQGIVSETMASAEITTEEVSADKPLEQNRQTPITPEHLMPMKQKSMPASSFDNQSADDEFTAPKLQESAILADKVSGEDTPFVKPESQATLASDSAKPEAIYSNLNKATKTDTHLTQVSNSAAETHEAPPANATKYTINQSEHKAELQVHRGDLGLIKAQIKMNQQQSTLTLLTENHEAKQVMSAQLAHLKEIFSDANMVLTEAQVEQRNAGEGHSGGRQHQLDMQASQAADENEASMPPAENKTHQTSSLIDAYI